MSKTVDQKVVEMRFDNKNFEKNVKQSMSTLDRLKAALRMDGVSRGLEDVERRANTLRFHGLADTVTNLADKFSGLQMVGTMAMVRIAQSAANAGINLVKSLSVDNVISGWNKLQQKANSMSTLISQGYKTEVVEEQLEKLLWFSDETSYNFTDMIDNIAKFTASGQELESSVTAMQGIALWAAKSGQNAQKASAAMYQLSQALGAGVMRKEDWKSIQNASMDTDEFRQQALDAAVALGTLKKVGKDTYQSLRGNKGTFTKQQFAENLTEGQWFTTDVMMDVYQKYAKASDQFNNIINKMSNDHGIDLIAGDLIRAYDAFNGLAKDGTTFESWLKEQGIDGEAANQLKLMVSELDKFGVSTFRAGQEYRTFNDVIDATKDAVSTKWMSIFETVLGNIDQQKELWSTIGESFYEWFAEPLNAVQAKLSKWSSLGGRDVLFEGLGNVVKAIGNIIGPVKEAFREVFPPATAEAILNLTKNFKELTSHLIIGEKSMGYIKSIFKAFFSVLKTGITITTTIVKAVVKLVSVFTPLGELVLYAASGLSKFVDKAAETARNSTWLSNALTTVVDIVKKFGESVGNMVKKLVSFESLVNFFKGIFTVVQRVGTAVGKFFAGIVRNGDLNQVMKIINSGLISGLLIKLSSLIKGFKQITTNTCNILEDLSGILQSYQRDIDAKMLLKIAGAVGILVASLWVLSSIDGAALTKGIGAMALVMAELMVAFKVFTKLNENTKVLARNSLALISLSLSLLILSSAIKKIGALKFGEMVTGLAGLAGAMGVLVGAIYLLPDDGKTKKKTKGLITLSVTMLIMAEALRKMGSMNIVTIIKGLATMFASLLITTKLLEKMNPEGAIRKSLSLLVLANSMIILSGALKILGSMSWGEILKGLTAMGLALLELTIAMNLMPKTGGVLRAAGLLGATMSLVVLGGALKILGTMNWSDIGRSLAAMGGALALLIVAMKIMGSSVKTALAGSGALIIAANSLIILGLGLKLLGSMKWSSILKGLVALAGVLTVLGVAGGVMAAFKLDLVLLAIAGAAALFGVAALAFGAGLSLIAAGITALAVSLAGGATAIVAGLSAIILGILGMIPEIVKTMGLAIAEFCKVIIECAPLIAQALGTVLLEAVKMLKDFVPPIVTAILDLFINTIRAITNRVPELILSIAELIQAIFKGFMEAMEILDSETLINGMKAIGLIAGVFIALAGLAVTAPLAMVGIVAFGLLLAELAMVLRTMSGLKSMVSAVEDAGDVLQAVGTAIGKFIGGIIGGFGLGVSATMPDIATNLSTFMTNLQPFLNGVSKVKPDIVIRMSSLAGGILVLTAANFITGLANLLTIGSSLPKLGKDLSDFMKNAKPFIDSAILISPTMMDGVKSLAGAITVLTGANMLKSISSLFTWITGDNSFAKFGEEIASLGLGMKNFAKNLGTFNDSQVESIKAACDAISALAVASKKIPNEGGVWGWLAGDNSLGQFSGYLPKLGKNLSDFAKNLGTFSSAQLDSVNAAGTAIVKLSEAAKQIPNEGGLWAALAGDNSISTFSGKLPQVGADLALFAKNLGTFTDAQVATVGSAATAIAEMAKAAEQIPNSGGLVSLFTGDNDILLFAAKLPLVGASLKGFAKSLGNFSETQGKVMESAANAIGKMAKAAKNIPNEGGLVTLFTGDNDISTFSNKLPQVGSALAGFATNLGTFSNAQVTTVDCAGQAIARLAEAASKVPTTGKLSKWFMGESDISAFSAKFPGVATDLAAFVTNLGTFSDAQVATTDCAGKAIASLATAAKNLPLSSGLVQWFTGESDISTFANKFPGIGTNLAAFVNNLGTFSTAQVDTVNCAGQAISKMASAANEVPNTGGLKQWFTGEKDISAFADKLPGVGTGIKGLANKLGTFTETQVKSIQAGVDALKYVVKFNDNVKDVGDLKSRTDKLTDISTGIKNFITGLAGISAEDAELAKTNSKDFYDLVTQLSSTNLDSMKTLGDSMKNVGETSLAKFIEAFSGESPKTKVSQAMRDLVNKMIDTMESKRSEIITKTESVVTSICDTLNNSTNIDKMKTAGKNFTQGFADGITSNRYLVVDAGTSLGNAAYDAAKRAIDAHSPSKKAHKLGNFFGLGFVKGIGEYTDTAYNESYSMADQASKGLTSAISKVNDILNDGTTNQPMIRPVLDLSDVENEAGRISGLFNNVGIGSNLNAISIGMRQNRQNGNGEVVSAINKLGSNLGKSGDTYNINGVTYDNGSEVQNAVEVLIRAANIERRA